MERVGKILTCDKCGKEVFLDYVGEGEADGGFTRWLKFSQKPDGWQNVSTPIEIKGYPLLCDECYKKFVSHLKEFFDDRIGG